MLLALIIALGTLLLLAATVVFHHVRRLREALRRSEALRDVAEAVEEHKVILSRGEKLVARLDDHLARGGGKPPPPANHTP